MKPKRKTQLIGRYYQMNNERLLSFGQTLKRLPSLRTIKLDFTSCARIDDVGMNNLGFILNKMRFLQNLHVIFWE